MHKYIKRIVGIKCTREEKYTILNYNLNFHFVQSNLPPYNSAHFNTLSEFTSVCFCISGTWYIDVRYTWECLITPLPSTLDPWFCPAGRGHSGVYWFPIRIICSCPLKGWSGQPAIKRPPCVETQVILFF